MFESFKQWFEARDQESQLFEHPNSLILYIALAALLYHVVSADGLEHNNEKQ